jgi:hypothetical protein
MNIESILDELKFAPEEDQMTCVVPSAGIKSRIGAVGQVKRNMPGVMLGNREPYLREKTVGIFREELATFGSNFDDNDFLMQSTYEINEEIYELRYYKLTHIKVEAKEVVLHSAEGELEELRETHQEPECE